MWNCGTRQPLVAKNVNFIVEVTIFFLDLHGTVSARLASDRHSPTKYNEKKTFFGVLDVALHPFSVVRALFHTSYIWDTEISDMQFCNLSTADVTAAACRVERRGNCSALNSTRPWLRG